MSFLLALTGSIGMGKSTAAGLFKEYGASVWDADAAVHELYQRGGAGAEALKTIAPNVIDQGAVDRAKLSALIANAPPLLREVERVVHPLVALHRQAFITKQEGSLLVFEIPLLFETGSQDDFDAVAVVSTSPEQQRERTLARSGMTPEKFEMILAKQVPDSEKRVMADYIIDSTSLETARRDVSHIVEDVLGRGN